MTKHENLPSYEANPRLRYAAGWSELLQAPDAEAEFYRLQLDDLTVLSQQKLHEANVPWYEDKAEVFFRWQRAIELVAARTISPDDLEELTPAQIVETAILTMNENIQNIDWQDEGISFEVPDMYTGEECLVDLRDLASLYPGFEAEQWLSQAALAQQLEAYQ